jgi:hypothetical protein
MIVFRVLTELSYRSTGLPWPKIRASRLLGGLRAVNVLVGIGAVGALAGGLAGRNSRKVLLDGTVFASKSNSTFRLFLPASPPARAPTAPIPTRTSSACVATEITFHLFRANGVLLGGLRTVHVLVGLTPETMVPSSRQNPTVPFGCFFQRVLRQGHQQLRYHHGRPVDL